ncbi:hypothetical protein [Streptomyces sp. KAI-26]|uniref:hypothetical protein n=1 Tax=Streptomyces sp. KAI-26 TaxID=1169747 RepID=UPI0020CA79AA|nr:hypothetical protein [Streptomyces sp. KAI-26]
MPHSNLREPVQGRRASVNEPHRTYPWRTVLLPHVALNACIATLIVVFRDRFFPNEASDLAVYGVAVSGFVVVTAGGPLLVHYLFKWSVRRHERRGQGERERHERLTLAEAALAAALRPRESTGEPYPARQLLGLPELWEATHARLDLYHQIATGQAKTSFRNAQVAMGAGFFLLVVFAGITLWASTTAVAIVAGGLGAVSAALAGYVAKTFIRSQEAAATHLRSYFDQPLELSRYLAAERLVADGDLTQEQRGEILSALVQAMVAGPQPPAPPQAVVVASVPGQQGL